MSEMLTVRRMRFSTMGCPAELCVYARSEPEADAALQVACTESRRLDRKYSHYRQDSTISELQKKAIRPGGCLVDDETAALLDFAACLYSQSEGRFDITAGHLTLLWERAEGIPAPEEMQTALAKTGWHRVYWDGKTLGLESDMRLNLGAIVKEYAADRIALLLRHQGHVSGYIDLGGDLHILGPHPDGRPWLVGVRHPRAKGALAGTCVSNGGFATSGDYERSRVISGRAYSHILDARDGWPVAGLTSVTVMAPSCLLAGAMTTLAMLLDIQAGLEFLATSGLRWLAHDGSRAYSGGPVSIDQTIDFAPSFDLNSRLHRTV